MRLRLEGRQPRHGGAGAGRVLRQGLRVYQAMVLRRRVGAEAADTFLGGLRLPA